MAENIPLENKHSEEDFDELPLPQNFDEESTKTNSEGCIQNELLKTFSTAIFEERCPFKSQRRSGMFY